MTGDDDDLVDQEDEESEDETINDIEPEKVDEVEAVSLQMKKDQKIVEKILQADIEHYGDRLCIPPTNKLLCGKYKPARLLFVWQDLLAGNEDAIKKFVVLAQPRIKPFRYPKNKLYVDRKIIAKINVINDNCFELLYEGGKSIFTKQTQLDKVLVETPDCVNAMWNSFYLGLIKLENHREVVYIPHWPCRNRKSPGENSCRNHAYNPTKKTPTYFKFMKFTELDRQILNDHFNIGIKLDLSGFNASSIPTIQKIMDLCDGDATLCETGRRILELNEIEMEAFKDDKVKEIILIDLAEVEIRKALAMKVWYMQNAWNKKHKKLEIPPPDITRETALVFDKFKELGLIGKGAKPGKKETYADKLKLMQKN